jgi:glycosyltransferase involved in cell wall biosynthesis
VDLYDPMILENLERFAGRSMAERRGLHNVAVNTFNDLFRLGDFYICASEKQRDYWLGALTAANRVNPLVYDSDPTLDRLIAVVPFGLPQEPPRAMEPALKGVWPGIGPHDKVILWGGGLWDWLDPLTVIAAMPAVLQAIPEARLFFLGTRHPNPEVPLSTMATRAMALAGELGLKDRTVFFNEWAPYAERANYLCDADVGVSLHGEHVETRFAVRTRLMDYLWARLPMVVNGGDVLGELVARHELGRLVASGDADGVAQAIIDLLRNPVEPQRYAPLVARFHWSAVAAPLREYVRAPWTTAGGGMAGTMPGQQSGATPLRQLPAKAFATLREKGLASLSKEVISYLRWISQQ